MGYGKGIFFWSKVNRFFFIINILPFCPEKKQSPKRHLISAHQLNVCVDQECYARRLQLDSRTPPEL